MTSEYTHILRSKIWDQKKEMRRDQMTCVQIIWDHFNVYEIEIRKMRYCWDQRSATEIEIRKMRYCWDQRSASEIEIRNMRYCLDLLRSEKAEITRSKKSTIGEIISRVRKEKERKEFIQNTFRFLWSNIRFFKSFLSSVCEAMDALESLCHVKHCFTVFFLFLGSNECFR